MGLFDKATPAEDAFFENEKAAQWQEKNADIYNEANEETRAAVDAYNDEMEARNLANDIADSPKVPGSGDPLSDLAIERGRRERAEAEKQYYQQQLAQYQYTGSPQGTPQTEQPQTEEQHYQPGEIPPYSVDPVENLKGRLDQQERINQGIWQSVRNEQMLRELPQHIIAQDNAMRAKYSDYDTVVGHLREEQWNHAVQQYGAELAPQVVKTDTLQHIARWGANASERAYQIGKQIQRAKLMSGTDVSLVELARADDATFDAMFEPVLSKASGQRNRRRRR